MKILYVARHATAEPQSPSGTDFDRRLALRGEIEIVGIAARAAALGHGLDLIVASPAARTLATALAYQRAFGLTDDKIKTDRSMYTDESGHLAALVRALPSTSARVMLVGHNPVIGRLAHWLDGSEEVQTEFVPATIAAYRLDVDRWDDVHPSLSERLARLSPMDGASTSKREQ